MQDQQTTDNYQNTPKILHWVDVFQDIYQNYKMTDIYQQQNYQNELSCGIVRSENGKIYPVQLGRGQKPVIKQSLQISCQNILKNFKGCIIRLDIQQAYHTFQYNSCIDEDDKQYLKNRVLCFSMNNHPINNKDDQRKMLLLQDEYFKSMKKPTTLIRRLYLDQFYNQKLQNIISNDDNLQLIMDKLKIYYTYRLKPTQGLIIANRERNIFYKYIKNLQQQIQSKYDCCFQFYVDDMIITCNKSDEEQILSFIENYLEQGQQQLKYEKTQTFYSKEDFIESLNKYQFYQNIKQGIFIEEEQDEIEIKTEVDKNQIQQQIEQLQSQIKQLKKQLQ